MRTLEAIWGIIGVVMIAMLIYDLIQFPDHGFKDRLVYIVGAAMAAMMYTFRRKQRQKWDQHKKNGQGK